MEWLKGLAAGTIVTIIGYLLAVRQRRVERRDEQIEAVAALRFEVQSNLGWIDGIFDSCNYLRDEAWVTLKNKGYISYLPAPIPMRVIAAYGKLHSLNRHIHDLKSAGGTTPSEVMKQDRVETRHELVRLVELLDIHFPRLARNFRT